MDYRFRQAFGFSPPIPDIFGFGSTVHAAVEKLHERFRESPPSEADAAALAREVFHLKHVPQSGDPVNSPGPYERARDKAAEIVGRYAGSYHDDFVRQRQIEARFEIPATDSVISGSIDLLLKEDERGEVTEAEVVDFKAIKAGDDPEENPELDWTELSLQVQLYAKAAREVLGENTRTGSVHLLRDDQRVRVPIDGEAVDAAVANVEWAVQGIIAQDFPMRPYPTKCPECDFRGLCSQKHQDFRGGAEPPPEIHVPAGREAARSFSQCDSED